METFYLKGFQKQLVFTSVANCWYEEIYLTPVLNMAAQKTKKCREKVQTSEGKKKLKYLAVPV